jgi:GT2 family glycosyltransferase
MPVFNRIAMTKNMLQYLRSQDLSEDLSIIVIDDGSEDETPDFLSTQSDLIVLKGDGSLWWGGAIDLGLRYLFSKAKDDVWVLLVNNDMHIQPNYLQALMDVAKQYHPCAVGSLLRDVDDPNDLLSIGARVKPWLFIVNDCLDDQTPKNVLFEQEPFQVDALSGRGVLYPLLALRTVDGVRSKWLPHYLADYELSFRIKKAGWSLCVTSQAPVYSSKDFGNTSNSFAWHQRFLSIRSPYYLPAQLAFWWSASNLLQKITLPIRLITFMLFPFLRKI